MISVKDRSSNGQVSLIERVVKGFRFIISHNILGPLSALVFVVIIFTIGTYGAFLSLTNLQTILSLAGLLAITTLGSSSVILIGAIDLSTEGVIALAGIICGFLVKNPRTPYINLGFWALPAIMLIGGVTGCVNGVINTKLKIPSFIATLGMWFAAAGLGVIISRGETTMFSDPRLQNLANGYSFGIPNITLIAIVMILMLMVMQKRTGLGKHIFAVGGDEVLAKQAGINVERVKIIVFALAGCLYGMSAFFIASRLNGVNPMISQGMLFPAITATVVGGTSLSGGIGGALNAFIGALVVTALNNGMILMQINPYVQGAVNGIVLIGAVAITLDRKKIGIIK